jgi:hypothetical protein
MAVGLVSVSAKARTGDSRSTWGPGLEPAEALPTEADEASEPVPVFGSEERTEQAWELARRGEGPAS